MRTSRLFSCLAVILLATSPVLPEATASTDFGVPRSLPITGIAGSTDLATDGQGVWVSVWITSDATLGVTAGQTSVAFSRSIDDGETWSAPQLIRPEIMTSAPDYLETDIATDGQGNWIVSHSAATYSPVASGVVQISASSDDGATWGAPVTMYSSATRYNAYARIESDGAGTWIVVWDAHDDSIAGGGTGWSGVAFRRSTDGGATWSPAARLNNVSSLDGGVPAIAWGSNGTWGVVWRDWDYILQFVRSTDNGQTWSAQTPLGGGVRMSLASDGQGRWVAVSENLVKIDIWQSTDDGMTWQLRGGVPEVNHVFQHSTSVISRGSGEWQFAWQAVNFGHWYLGNDSDIFTMYSRDDGATWSTPATLVADARYNEYNEGGVVLANSPSKTIAMWSFSDGRKLATAVQACPATAREDCFQPSTPESASLSISDLASSKDRLVWKWGSGIGTTDADLGDPTVSGDYAVCLYEKSGSSLGLISEWDVRAATTCGADPCWKKKTDKVSYADRKLAQGSVTRLSVQALPSGDKLRVSMAAPALSPPRLPLDVTSPVRIQLINTATNACWESVHSQARSNEPDSFRSFSD
jgi:hypothetical protein